MAALWYAVRAQTPDGQPDESDAQQPKRAAIRIASSSPESFPEPDIMITTKPLIWASGCKTGWKMWRKRERLHWRSKL